MPAFCSVRGTGRRSCMELHWSRVSTSIVPHLVRDEGFSDRCLGGFVVVMNSDMPCSWGRISGNRIVFVATLPTYIAHLHWSYGSSFSKSRDPLIIQLSKSNFGNSSSLANFPSQQHYVAEVNGPGQIIEVDAREWRQKTVTDETDW